MVEEDLGEATIVYEDADGETVEKNVQNEHVAYFQDHWIVKTGEDERGRDLVRRIPSERVYHVERTVEEFEREVETLRDQVQSVADEIRTKFLGGGDSGRESTGRSESERIDIDVESGDLASGDGDDDEDRDEL